MKDLQEAFRCYQMLFKEMNAMWWKHIEYTSLDFTVHATEIRGVAKGIFRSALVTDQIPED
jgi:hypothetical protein